eukprot:Hpha_TRINITY_DN29932_c0_g1::TRINITY_DN29932_c0_g1_i1::g.131831::m.131831
MRGSFAIFLAVFAAAGDPPTPPATDSEGWDAVAALLSQVAFPVPKIQFKHEETVGSIQMKVNHGTCRIESLGDIRMEPQVNANDTEITLTVGFSGVGVSCQIDAWYQYHAGVDLMSGDTDVDCRAQDASMTISIAISADGQPFTEALPSKVNLVSSDVQLSLPYLHFSGNVKSKVINFASPLFRRKVEDAMKNAMQKDLAAFAVYQSNKLLGLVANKTAGFRVPQTPNRLVDEDALGAEAGLLNFTGSTMIKLGSGAVDNFLAKGDPLGVNKVITMLEGGSEMGIKIDAVLYNQSDVFSHTTVKMTNIAISGIDSFSRFEPLEVLADHTLRHRFVVDHLEVEVHGEVIIAPTDKSGGASSSAGTIVEKVMAKVTLGGAKIDATSSMGIDEATGSALSIGEVYNTPLGCCLSALRSLNITDLALTVERVSSPRLSGFISGGLDQLFNQAALAAWMLYASTFKQYLPTITRLEFLPLLNKALQNYLKGASRNCPVPDVGPGNPFVDFQASPLFGKIKGAVDGALKSVDLNEAAIRPLTKNQSGYEGRLELKEGGSFHVDTHPGKTGVRLIIDAGLEAFHVDGLDSLDALSLLNPISGVVLNNSFDFAAPPTPPIRIVARVAYHISTDRGQDINNNFTITLHENSVSAALAVLAQVDQRGLESIRLDQVLNPQCWLATLQRGGVDGLNLNFGKVVLSVDCHHCSSPQLRAMHKNAQSEETTRAITAAINHALGSVVQVLMGASTEDQIRRLIDSAEAKCTGVSAAVATPPPAPSKSNTMHFVALVLVILALGALLCTWVRWRRRLQRSVRARIGGGELLGDDESGSGDEVSSLLELRSWKGSIVGFDRRSSHGSKGAEDEGVPLLQDPRLSARVRFGIPAVLVWIIIMFISGHVTIGASVDLEVGVAGDTLQLREFAKFSLGRSIKDMWHAGAYFLAVLVGSFSGAWPYAKVLSLLYCWCVPPTRLSPKRRGRLLEKLDVLGKWSLIDVFVLTMTMAGFRLTVRPPPALRSLEGEADFYDVSVVVTPCWGLYAFMIAATSSLVINVVMLKYHRQLNPTPGDAAAALRSTKPAPPKDRVETDFDDLPRASQCPPLRVAVLCLVIGSAAFTIYGATVPAFAFRIDGLAGLAIDAGGSGDLAENSYSLFSIIGGLRDQSHMTGQDHFGLGFIILSYLAFAFLAPLVQMGCVGAIWALPLTWGHHPFLHAMQEVIAAFSALWVFVVGIVVTVLEIGQVSSFLLKDGCASVQPYLDNILLPYGFISEEDATCFRISAKYLSGTPILVVTLLVSSLVTSLVLRLSKPALEAEAAAAP